MEESKSLSLLLCLCFSSLLLSAPVSLLPGFVTQSVIQPDFLPLTDCCKDSMFWNMRSSQTPFSPTSSSVKFHNFIFTCRIWISSLRQENYKHAIIKSLILKSMTPWWYNYDSIYFRVWSKAYLLRAIRVKSVEDIQCAPDWESDIWIWRSSICQWTKAAGSAGPTWMRRGFLQVQGRSLIRITLLL